jgi:pilus assembly protein CpaD
MSERVMTFKNIGLVAASALSLAACASMDLQGHDPVEFYAKHPIENKVETKHVLHETHFAPGAARLSADEIDALKAGLRDVPPMAVDKIHVQTHPQQVNHQARREHLKKLLRSMGFAKVPVVFESSELLERDQIALDVAYAQVVSPRCPDWRTSPITTYSNTQQGGYGCASVTNLGLMVADPRDLERGSGRSAPDMDRNAKVLQDYRSGVTPGAADGSSGDSGSGSSSSLSPMSAMGGR